MLDTYYLTSVGLSGLFDQSRLLADHICEGFGWLSAEDQTATCLPARAVLTIVPVG